jgi:hypothetical protein
MQKVTFTALTACVGVRVLETEIYYHRERNEKRRPDREVNGTIQAAAYLAVVVSRVTCDACTRSRSYSKAKKS